jgi:hypothetical protein
VIDANFCYYISWLAITHNPVANLKFSRHSCLLAPEIV